MSINLENVITSLIIGFFIVTSINSLNTLCTPITEEEAVRISKNSELVKEGLATNGYIVSIEATFYNSSWVERMKNYTIPWADPDEEWVKRASKAMREKYENIPEGHSIWQVTWWLRTKEVSIEGYTVIVIVDAETGTIINETKGIGFG
jgi:nicotinamide mononucleotide adenylyltransferase